MSRKAAAAGWDAAMRIKSLKKKTDDWKNRVKLYSYCTLLALKSFRTFMQFCVSVRLDRHALEDGGVAFFSRISRLLPTSVLEKLDAALSILLSVSEFRSLPTLVSGDDEGEVEDLFMPLRLYCESLTAWGECTALTTSSTSDREALLGNLVRDCFSNASTVQHFGSFDTLSSLPTTEDESQLYRLDILCRRFCVTDLLDHVVPRPLCFNPELESAGSLARDTDVADSERSEFSCSLVTLLYFSSLKASGACLRFLRRLSMAICHRCCVRGILWDGLYACSHFEADEAASSPASVPGSESLRVSGSPSSSLQLDSTKCSDSIAILSDSADSSSSSTGSSAHQRASKVWGTVVSSTYYNPKSGVHRWAVRLDRCERGHVFVGVATAQASVRTYVGGDKYGWGVIGTQALWHDRRKIRGDYGATFRTGSIIVVTLDTDAGTLSFSTWKDVNPSAGSFSLDPLSPTLSSPRRQTSSGGTLEDWGIAFEGLPLDAKLYPAVGLYQRDDMVTLLKVESGIRSGGQHTNVGIEQFAGGAGYFPGPNHSSKSSLEGFSSQMTRIRNHNSVLSWGSIEFVDSILGNIIDSIDSGDVGDRNLSLNTILPSIAAAVCLLPPSIPVLSARFALHLLSRLTECITRLDTVINDQQSLFSSAMKEGKWVIRATGSSGNGVNEFEEYVVNFKSKLSDNEGIIGFVGSGIGTTGKSKNGLVSITGTVYGSLVHFVEEWTDGVEEGTTSATEESSSSCIVSARLGLDAMKFEGTYRNVQYRTTGHIAGLFLSDREPVNSTDLTSENNDFTRSQAILRLAHGHLAMILGNDAAGDHAVRSEGDEEEERKVRCLSFLTSAPFREGFVDTDGHIMEKTLDSLRELYSGRGRTAAVLSSSAFVAPPTAPETNSSSSLVAEIAKLDGNVAPNNCRRGSFHSLCPDDYTEARLHVMASLFHHSGIGELFSRGHFGALDNLWNSALSIMDSQVRAALSDGPEGLSMKERGVMRCQHVVAVSRFLLSLQPSTDHPIDSEDIISTITLFFAAVHHQDDLKLLADEFAASMRRAFLRYVALTEVQDVLPPRDKLNTAMVVAFESTSVAIPRFLGRGLASKKTSTSRLAGRRYIDNGNHYMARLSGAGLFLRNKIRSSVHSIVANIGEVLCQISSSTTTSNVDRESSLLSILPVFATAMLSSDVENVVLRSQILDSLSVISSSNRAALRSTQCEGLPSNETENEFLVAEMRALIQRDVARTVVLTAVSVSHTLTYQTCQWSRQSDVDPNSDSISAALCGCVGLLLNEVEEVVPLMETAVREGLDRYLGAQGDDQYNSWVNITMPDSNQSEKAKRKRAAAKPLRPSLSHLFEKGMFAAVGGTTSTPTKAGSKAMSSGKAPFPSGSHYESLTSTGGLAFDLYVSRWLDVMHCVVWSAEASKALVNLGHWMDVMFSAIGLSIHRAPGGDVDGVVLRSFDLRIPAHYRARILRFLPTLLSLATADDRVVEGLFKIVGEANDVQANSLHGDESLVASESIACMRSLYSPGCHEWRKAIDRVIVRKIADRADVTSSDAFSLGVLAFLAGSITALGPGTHVLLKPAAAASLSQDAQSTPSSKSSAGSGSSNAAGGVASHHVVGTGTEGIVAGLCRSEAAAGVMSNIDTKTGMCEVILVERRRSNKPHLSSALSKVTLTVRALRSPLADVAKAEQIPLVLGPSFPVITFLHASLPSALAFFATTSQEIAVDGTFKLEHIQCLHASILTLRAAIVLLSDDRLLDEFKSHDGSRAILSELLHLAGKQECLSTKVLKPAGVESLASLPVHEGRYVHFVTMLAEIQVRRSTLEIAVEESWFRRANEIHARQTRKSEAVEENDGPQEVCADAASATMPSSGHEDSNLSRASRGDAPSSRRATSQSSVSSNSTEDEEESEAAATAASHLREAAIAQMLELGLPRSWSELALRRTGGTNIEAAVHFCLERGGDMERLLAEERERDRVMQRSAAGASRRRSNRSERSSHLLRQLLEMGFPSRWCAEALAATQNNVDEALTWILSNGVRLSEEDEGIDDDDGADFDEDEDEEDDDEEQPQPDEESDVARVSEREQSPTQPAEAPASATVATAADGDVSSTSVEEPRGWCGSVTPVRFISGRSIINSKTLSISGLPAGGFSSVGTKGVLLTSGKWYYEAILETAGCLQIGWADGSFSGHCHAERGDGCGDGPSSWAFDGWRRYRWHASATEWGCRWKEGDVVGCLVDMDEKIVSFTLNGKGEEVGMGVAFSGDGFRPCGGVYACVSFNRKEKLRLILGGEGSEPFTFSPPAGFVGVGEAILSAVREREVVLDKEAILLSKTSSVADGEFGSVSYAIFRTESMGTNCSLGNIGITGQTHPVSLLLEKRWSSTKVPNENHTIAKANMSESLVAVSNEVAHDALQEGFSLGILFSRKFILHLVITLGTKFELSLFESKDIGEVDAALRFWRVIDSCVSLRSAGWVGEAGAMAIAAEALGLGISSTEHQSKSQQSDRPGLSSIEWGEESILVPVAGISQLLSTIIIGDGSYDDFGRETWRSLAGCAESSIGADGGAGPLVFLQRGLQSSLCRSESLRSVLVATIRRSVRLLAVVDYSGDDSNTSGNGNPDDDMDTSGSNAKRAGDVLEEENAKAQQPDARLTCFLTGLLLSGPVQSCVSDKQQLFEDLLQAWSIGLLSASAPWRMVCALTAAGILNECPTALSRAVLSLKTVSNFYARLQDTVLRRVWAERAAVPVCSRYVQSLIELLASVRKAELTSSSFTWGPLQVDAATPLPLDSSACDGQMIKPNISPSWEWDEGWVANDAGWETWVGTVECTAVDWVIPSRSAVRSLMDGGEGPPMLREGCVVTRGLDWDDIGPGLNSDADGKKEYEREKSEREREKKALEEQAGDDPAESELDTGDLSNDEQTDALGSIESNDEDATAPSSESKVKTDTFKKKKRTKIANPKLPIGTVLSIEPWDGVPAMARKVRWQLTGEEGIYRYGGGGGRFDICHVEVNEKGTRVRKRHPLPESAEQCVARHGFGSGKYSVLLRLRRVGKAKEVERYEREWHHEGVLEWPDFGAGVKVDCVLYDDGSVLLKETDLLFGSKDSGWEARFGQPSFIPGTEIMLSPTGSTRRKDMAEVDAKSSFMSVYQELLGSTSHVVNGLRNKSDGSSVRVTMEMKLLRGRRPDSSIKLPNCLEYTARSPPPISFDRDYHASSMTLSRDGRTLTCVSPDGRGSAFASIGFTRGVHYWEVKLEQADIGSVYIGVAEKPNTAPSSGRSSFGNENSPRLNRWLGWGFVNFRATYTAGAERVYGAHCHNEDTVGVLLDCDAGRVSFFYDGMKFGEHILNDLGCAFENISPFGFNADGCGSGGAGQGAPSGIEGGRGGRYHAHGVVRPRALWPVIGLRNPGDRVTMSTKWTTCGGIEGSTALKNALAVDELIDGYGRREAMAINTQSLKFPDWFVREAFDEYRRWHSRRWYATATRSSGQYRLAAFGLDVELDCSPLACAAACAAIGLRRALLSGDRVVVKRSVGRPLELAEEAVILGAHQCRLYYRLVSQKSEGGSLTAGGGRAWFWDESEVVGDSLQIVGEAKGRGVDLPLIDRFRCMSSGGIKVVYEGGAVVRSDLEIIDRSSNLGTIPANTIIPPFDVLERRVNSCGVIRYRIRYEGVGEGWISSRIRGGKEESIIEPVHDSSKEEVRHELSFRTPEEAAIAWYDQFKSIARPADDGDDPSLDEYNIATLDEFSRLASEGVIPGISILESDSIVTTLVSTIADYSGESDAIDCSFPKVAAAVTYAVASSSGLKVSIEGAVADGANQAAATVLTSAKGRFPSGESLMARMALIRALNRRVRKALPWLPARPSQEGTAILGGLCGHGASVERAGRRKLADSMALWVQVPSIASRVRSLKGLIFSSVKLEYLESVILATATPTPLSHDEYELPREIRTVRVNRLKARRVMAGTDLRMKRKHSVFAQLQSETKAGEEQLCDVVLWQRGTADKNELSR
ncbi:HECT-domain (ubiquitin-transferase) [Fragilaria crotonensis]|nr:HECT-domain (ubiquitin-transferase) [Fragilaria crotonensis]